MAFTNIHVHKLYIMPHINMRQQNMYNRLLVTQQYIITQNADSSKQ
jgi:hypothetical protein